MKPAKLLLALIPLALLGLGADDCEDGSGDPTPTQYPDGALYAEVDNFDPMDLIPITTVEIRPIGADPDQDEFATSFSITTSAGELGLSDALGFLGLEFNISSVLVTCSDGTPLLFNGFSTCPGSTAEERQTRVVTFLALPGGGVFLDPEDVQLPFITFKMTEVVDSGSRLEIPGTERQPETRERPTVRAGSGQRDYVQPMGMF